MNQTIADLQVVSNTCHSEIDIRVLRNSMSNDFGAIKMLLEIFVADHCKDGHLIRHCIQGHRLAEARIAVHSLKGVAGSVGATGLRDVACHLDQILKTQKNPTEHHLKALEHRLAQAVISANYHISVLTGSE
ncbi:Hpt domain-containing protein [Vibrio salinus]|uniref:Hpt domain-containing protein n=1 Tax=Vibrio salinus TaxID=2899784 RepID=UPI001E2E97D4|nr:Hpt domain-containing protein [Vibrio salinus]MCE0494605.1 Hpt domain-containing protein [Vibrio salinus]